MSAGKFLKRHEIAKHMPRLLIRRRRRRRRVEFGEKCDHASFNTSRNTSLCIWYVITQKCV